MSHAPGDVCARRPTPLPTPMAATASQKNIIEYPCNGNEILAVKAGPGSGKTLTLANRIAYLMSEHGLDRDEILVLSMTNRAVNSLRQTLAGTPAADVNIFTFHSFCAALVDESSPGGRKRLMDDLSWRNFSNIFLGKSIEVAGTSLKGNMTASLLEKVLHSIKSGESTVEDVSKQHNISKEYINALLLYLEKNGIMRYQDFISDALALMETNKHIPRLLAYRAVIVDEFQDMHYLLLQVIKKIVSYKDDHLHLTLAGDPHQSIYEFLGSRPELINTLDKEFPSAKITYLHIKESFRLTPEILDVAKEFALRKNQLLLPGDNELVSTKPSGHKPILYQRSSLAEEHDFIAMEITRLILELGGLLRPADFLILVRTNKELDEIQQHFTERYGLACNKFSLQVPWINSKVHVLLDLLNVLNNETGADFGLLCVVMLLDKKYGSRLRVSKLFSQCEKWRLQSGLGDVSLEAFLRNQFEVDKKQSVLQNIYKNSPETLERLKVTIEGFERERTRLSLDLTPFTVLQSLLNLATDLGITAYLNATKTGKKQVDQDTSRKQLEQNLTALCNSLEFAYDRYNQQETVDEPFLSYFLRVYNDNTDITNKDMINLSTVHTAKGLEFPVVFIPGCTSFFGSRPYWSSLLSDTAKPEPSKGRLFYVASTRAKNLLYMGTDTKVAGPVSRYFDWGVPDLAAKNLLHSLACDMKRPVPSPVAVEKGRSVFRTIGQTNHSPIRNIHTSALRLIQRNLRRFP